MAFHDPLFQLGMTETHNFGRMLMGKMNELEQEINNLVVEAIRDGARNTSEIYGFVTQYVSPTLVEMSRINDIIRGLVDVSKDG
jgi:hypothetical protein